MKKKTEKLTQTLLLFFIYKQKNIHSKLFCYLNIHKYYCCFFSRLDASCVCMLLASWAWRASEWERYVVCYCLLHGSYVFFEETKADSRKKNESVNEERKKMTTITTAKQSFFIMMTITIILITYALFFCHLSFIYVISCCPHPFQYLLFLFSFDQTKYDTHTHTNRKMKTKKRRFYEKSTEENEIEKHSSYGLHIYVYWTHMGTLYANTHAEYNLLVNALLFKDSMLG